MDWDMKMMPPPWDFSELEPNAETNIGSIVGSSSARGMDCSVDLKLGGLGDFSSIEKWKDHLRVSTGVSPPGSSKRARAPSNASQNVSCLVEGCKADLSRCREYHRRHKVCEAHSKTPIVIVGGQEQRFCQQCSRFHLLVEFDEVKRSCRKRLDGHNRRRRKPQPESINPATIFSNHQGARFSSYPQMFPTAVTTDPTWPVIVKTEEDLYTRTPPPMHFVHRNHPHFLNKQFPFLQESEHASSISQPLLKNIASAESSTNSNKMFDSDCALSLLSSPQQIPMGQPLLNYGGNLGFGRYSGSHRGYNPVSATGFSCSGTDTVLVSDGSEAEMNCQVLFGEGSSDAGSQALPFSWQ